MKWKNPIPIVWVCLLVVVNLGLSPALAPTPGDVEDSTATFDVLRIADSGSANTSGAMCSKAMPRSSANQNGFCTECFERSFCLLEGFLCTSEDTSSACKTCQFIFCLPCGSA